jgi:hypothetical protein
VLRRVGSLSCKDQTTFILYFVQDWSLKKLLFFLDSGLRHPAASKAATEAASAATSLASSYDPVASKPSYGRRVARYWLITASISKRLALSPAKRFASFPSFSLNPIPVLIYKPYTCHSLHSLFLSSSPILFSFLLSTPIPFILSNPFTPHSLQFILSSSLQSISSPIHISAFSPVPILALLSNPLFLHSLASLFSSFSQIQISFLLSSLIIPFLLSRQCFLPSP